jgi:hypothetical protein
MSFIHKGIYLIPGLPQQDAGILRTPPQNLALLLENMIEELINLMEQSLLYRANDLKPCLFFFHRFSKSFPWAHHCLFASQ